MIKKLNSWLTFLFLSAFLFSAKGQLCTQVVHQQIMRTHNLMSQSTSNVTKKGTLIRQDTYSATFTDTNLEENTTYTAQWDKVKVSYLHSQVEGKIATILVYIDGKKSNTRWVADPSANPNNYFLHEPAYKILEGVKGKTIHVVVKAEGPYVQTSAQKKTNITKIKIEEFLGNQMKSRTKKDGLLLGKKKKSFQTIGACTGKTRVILRRLGGNAKATIEVFLKSGNSWRKTPSHTHVLNTGQDKKIFTVHTNKNLKLVLRNNSVGNTFKYQLNAIAIN